MEKRKFDTSKISVIMTLAIWNFVFLGTEYLFDNMMAYVTDAEGVVIAQSRILGASVIGFFLYPLFKRQQKAGIKNILLFAASFISVICIFLIQERSSYRSIMIAGCLIFVLFGMAGGVIHKKKGSGSFSLGQESGKGNRSILCIGTCTSVFEQQSGKE